MKRASDLAVWLIDAGGRTSLRLLAKVRVAGSNPVVRSRESAGQSHSLFFDGQ